MNYSDMEMFVMTNTKKYLLQRATLLSVDVILMGFWLATIGILPWIHFAIFLILLGSFWYQQTRLDKGKKFNIYKIQRDGFPQAIEHADEREAHNGLNAMFYSERMTLIFIFMVLVLSLIWTYNSPAAVNFFNIKIFALFIVLAVLIQQWSFYLVYSYLDR